MNQDQQKDQRRHRDQPDHDHDRAGDAGAPAEDRRHAAQDGRTAAAHIDPGQIGGEVEQHHPVVLAGLVRATGPTNGRRLALA